MDAPWCAYEGSPVKLKLVNNSRIGARKRHRGSPFDNSGRAGLRTALRARVRALLVVVALTPWIAQASGCLFARGSPELVVAAYKGDLAAVRALLAKRANVNARNSGGVTALVASPWGGNVDVTKALIVAGADVNAVDNDGGTALLAAAGTPHTDIVRVLIEAGADVNASDGTTPLIQAALNGQLEQVQMLLARHANVNVKNSLGQTALMVAGPVAYTGQSGMDEALATRAAIIAALIEAGADVNAKDNQGRTAIQYQGTNSHVADMLRRAGAKE